MYLPIAAEAEAASRAAALPPGKPSGEENLPARTEPDSSLIPNLAGTAARWIRPFVPPIIARAIDTTTSPLRTARQVFEEVEEMTFSFKRTHRVTVDSGESIESTPQAVRPTTDSGTQRIDSSRLDSSRLDSSRPEHSAVEPGSHEGRPELGGWDGPGALGRGHGSPELPPAE